MEQRLLRLGDIVDDYCPRERRVTNHAIVAIVENTIRQTRCSTCDAEHEYKEAKVPKKRTKSADGSDLAGGVLVTKAATNGAVPASEEVVEESPAAAASAAPAPEPEEETPQPEERPQETWFTHRPLIRASLPKVDGEAPPPRAIPEFTMHQRQGRGFGRDRGGFRHGFHGNNGSHSFRGNGHGHSNGNGDDSQGQGNEPDGNRAGQPQRPGGGGRRRRRRRR